MEMGGTPCQTKDNMWTNITTEWKPMTDYRSQGRQKTRCSRRDEIVKFAGMTWVRTAQDRSNWYELGGDDDDDDDDESSYINYNGITSIIHPTGCCNTT